MKLEVDFGSMTQKNMMTGWKRNIRCVPSKPHPLPSASQWEWQDEHGSWNPYSSEVQRLLRACRLCSVEQWEIEASGRCYRVEMGAGSGEMVQVNVETGVKREVRCTATAAPATDPNGESFFTMSVVCDGVKYVLLKWGFPSLIQDSQKGGFSK